MKKIVILLNLGGPDTLSSVKTFLFNLFYDPAIIRLPNPFRWCLAKFISSKREKTAQEIYSNIGGKSPILEITQKQAALLKEKLGKNFEVFIAMRYSYPRAIDVIKELEQLSYNQIILLPLYPQYSTTTTKSSIDEFKKLLPKQEFKIINSYHNDPLFIKAHVELIKESLVGLKGRYRLLFSAHGLPEFIVKDGDPYQKQIEETVKLIMNQLGNMDHVVCYQSKVGRLKWLEPSTETELKRAAKEDVSVVVIPISFVSDHSETLVELDIEYREIFEDLSEKEYRRVNALNYNQDFINCLKNKVLTN